MCFFKKSSWYGFAFVSGVFPNFLIFFKQANLLQWMLLCCFGDFFCRYYWIRRLAVIWFLQCFVGWGLWRRIEKGYCPGKECIWDYFLLVLISSDSLHGKSNRGVSKYIPKYCTVMSLIQIFWNLDWCTQCITWHYPWSCSFARKLGAAFCKI